MNDILSAIAFATLEKKASDKEESEGLAMRELTKSKSGQVSWIHLAVKPEMT